MTFLERLADDVSSAVARSSRIIGRWILRRIADLFHIYRTIIIYVALLYLGSCGHELTYGGALLLRFFGWSVILAISGFIIYSIYELARRLFRDTSGDDEETALVWIGSSIGSFGIILLLLTVHHEFRSPILAATQSLPTDIKSALFSDSIDGANREPLRLGETRLRFSSAPSLTENGQTHLSLWVEGIRSTNVATILDVACKTWRDSESSTLADASGAYLIDQFGHKFNLTKDLGEYSFFGGERKIVGGEIYRWSLVFPGIGADTTTLRLKHPQFQEIRIDIGSSTIQVTLTLRGAPSQSSRCDPKQPWLYIIGISLKETNGTGVKLSRILVDDDPRYSFDDAGLPHRVDARGEATGQVRVCFSDNDGVDTTLEVEGVDDGGVQGSWIGTTRFPGTRKEGCCFVSSGGDGLAFRLDHGVSAPVLLSKVEPEYSEEASKAKYQGILHLYLEVNPSGEAVNIRVIHGLGMGLDEKAMEAVRKWKFKPGYKDVHPVTVQATVEIVFRLL